MINNLTLSLLLLFVVAGCATKAGHPISHYTLQTPSGATTAHAKKFKHRTLQIAIPQSTLQIRTRKMHYARHPYEREAYAYSRWSDTPNALLYTCMRTFLEQSALFKAVIDANSVAHGDLLLESYIDTFYQLFKSDTKAYAVLKMHFVLIDTHTKRVLSEHSFSLKAPSPSPDARGGAEAFNKAVQLMARDLIVWLSQLEEKKP